jgi:zinc/manganese transport system permease protein
MMDVLLNALLLSFVLLGIHAYLGMEVVRRGIIFTDIAIAQASAVGLALSLFLFDRPSYLLSLLSSLLAGVLVLLSQRLRDYAEAFIGLLYALGFSLVVLVLSKSPHGMEEFLKLSAKDILFVPREEVIKTGILYAVFGLFLYLREKFLKGFWSELAFFVLFSLTITSSVSLVGVLIVFSILVAPALVSLLLKKGLLFAWVYGAVINTAGIVLSFYLDLPTGFSLVFLQALFGILMFISALFLKGFKGINSNDGTFGNQRKKCFLLFFGIHPEGKVSLG